MERELLVYLASVAAIIAGLVIVVFVEFAGADRMLLLVGGGVALAGFAAIAATIARLPEPDGEGEHGGH